LRTVESLSSGQSPSTHYATWKALQNGNKEAFAFLYIHYFQELFEKNRNLADDKELINDCIHDLFVEIWDKRTRLSVPHSIHAYLQSSIRRKLFKCLREQRSRHLRLEINEMTTHSIEDILIGEQIQLHQSRLLLRAISCLSRRQQRAVYLKFYSGMSCLDIARDLAVSKRSVYNMVSRAISTLQRCMNRTDLIS
jgi:RNA polymerase sigma factor (sigma-70 family)